MFSLRDILSQLPPDDATRWIRVENVVSPMSSAEVLKLFPDAVSWEFLSNVRRTNFVITFRNESYARKAMQRACGLSYLGEKLILSYATAAQSSSATQPARVTTSQPFLYLLPPEFSYESRLTEADRMIASLDAMDSWNSDSMLSWDPKSYVTEAFSRILIEEAKKDKADVVPSYYDAVTGHLESHELSKRISASIRDQKDQNSSIAFDLNNSTLEVMYNPENQEGVNLTERKIENIFHLVMDKFQRVSEELKIVHANGGKVLVSNELFHILCHIQHMCELTNYRHCFASTKGGMCLSAKESSERLASMKLKDDSTVEWPDGMTLDLSGYLEAWLVDKMLEQLETLDGLRGCLVRFKSIAHAFGVPSGGSLWKCGVLTVDIDGEEKFIGCVGLGSFRPAAVTNTVQTSTSVLSAMQHCTACCKTAVVSCCLSAVISSLIEKEGALSFIREWRVSHGPETAESLLSFTLFFGFDKPISDEEDTTIGEHDDERMLLHDRRGHIAQAYQQLEAVVLNESHVANVVLNNKNADFFHNVSVVNRTTIDCLEEAICFFPNLCVLASYVDELGTTSVTTLKAADFPRGDDTFLFCISQRSPLFNRVFAKKSQITLNFLYENAKGIYEALSTAYPLWINEGGNEPVFLERNSRTCATTKFLVDVSDQETFETSESFLVGEDVLVIGKCLDGVPNKVTTSINKMFVVNHPFPSREFYPFLFTIVHKLYGTVGFVGYGCQLCTLSPLSMLIYCPVEASSFVLDEEHTGPKCNLTFFSKAGSFIFAGKTLGELRCGMPAELSVINALPPECFFFQAEGMLVRTIRGPSNKYVICLVAISNGHSFPPYIKWRIREERIVCRSCLSLFESTLRWDMVVEYLASADVQRLLDLLSEGKVNFSAVEKEFKAIFSKDSFFNVSKTLQRLMHGMIASPEGIGLVSSFFILDVMCRMDCEAAKSSFYDALLELEKAIRQDVCIMEQIKYASKDTKEAKKAYESNSCEKYRLRSAVKSFAFRLLANKVTSDETPLTAITDKQEQIDAALNTWESNNVQLKESIAEVAHSWSQDTEKNACEALSRTSVVLDHRGHAALILKPSTPHLPSLALTSGELQFLLPSLSLNDLLLIHGDPPTEVWKTAKQMITAGCKGLLSKEDQHKLLQTLLSDDVFARVGINSALLSRMAEYNPDVAASLILMLSPHEANNCIQNILKSSIPSEHVETVLLHASRVLQQTSLRAYITNKLHYFKEKATLSSEDKDAVKNFIRTLHQLLTKASKDNKEIYVAEALKGDITRLCEKCDVPEVTARWDELK